MSDDEPYRVGRGRPPKHSQFRKGQSGNPRGRRRKPQEGLTPNQLTKDILRVMDLTMTVKTPAGEKTLTIWQASIYSIAKRAIGSDKVSYMRLWLQLQREAVQQNVTDHPELLNIDLFDQLAKEQPDEPAYVESLKYLIRKSKGH